MVRTKGQDRLLIAGMDKYFISSQVAFYDPRENGSMQVTGRHLVSENSLMWSQWKPTSSAVGQNVLLLSFERDELEKSKLDSYFVSLGQIKKQQIAKNKKVVSSFYYRVGYNYVG
jgi:dolichol-phosphate mannosyltransferase